MYVYILICLQIFYVSQVLESSNFDFLQPVIIQAPENNCNPEIHGIFKNVLICLTNQQVTAD